MIGKDLGIDPEASRDFEITVTAVVTLVIHPVVTKDNKECILIKGVDNVLKDVVHLLLFCEHRGVVRTIAVPNMVNAEEMAKKKSLRSSSEEGRGTAFSMCVNPRR